MPPPNLDTAASTAPVIAIGAGPTGLSAAWRNRDLPNRVRSGESGHAPLPLDLYYLITAGTSARRIDRID